MSSYAVHQYGHILIYLNNFNSDLISMLVIIAEK